MQMFQIHAWLFGLCQVLQSPALRLSFPGLSNGQWEALEETGGQKGEARLFLPLSSYPGQPLIGTMLSLQFHPDGPCEPHLLLLCCPHSGEVVRHSSGEAEKERRPQQK